MKDTIAAIATAQGAAGIGVVRVSGPQALPICDRIFKGEKALNDLAGYTAAYGRVGDDGEDIDECVALVFRAPKSYTGEDTVELSCHGGSYVLQRVLSAVFQAGARPAQPGEFTKRAFLNGKIDLTQAEAVSQLIAAKGQQAAAAALAARDGALFKQIRGVTQTLLSLTAHLGAWADFPEEDIPEINTQNLNGGIADCIERLGALQDSYRYGKILQQGVQTAIVGKPNVGKSTLLNLLAGTDRSIVTQHPGTTRDVVQQQVMVGNILLHLADTAGLRDTTDPIEQIGVQKAQQTLERAELILAVFDSACALTEQDRILLEQVKNRAVIAVINKTDLPQKIDDQYIKNNIKHIVYISAQKGEGISALESTVIQVLQTAGLDPDAGILANERQLECVTRAMEGVEQARRALEEGMTLDAVTVSLEDAIDALLELTGEKTTEAVVDQVFHSFCVGK